MSWSTYGKTHKQQIRQQTHNEMGERIQRDPRDPNFLITETALNERDYQEDLDAQAQQMFYDLQDASVETEVALPTARLPWANSKSAKVFVDRDYISDSRFIVPASLHKHPKHIRDIIKFHKENSDKMPSGTWNKEGAEWHVKDGHPPLAEWVEKWMAEAKPAYPTENGDTYRILTSEGSEYVCETDCFEPIMLATDKPQFGFTLGITEGGIVVIMDEARNFCGAIAARKVG